MSMLSDAFPARRRATAISVLSIGGGMGTTLGALISGALNDRFGWHVALLAVAAPGFLLALGMLLTVTEPPRARLQRGRKPPSRRIGASLRHIWTTPTFRRLLAAMICKDVAVFAWQNWMPTFLIRVHHLSTSEMGAIFGLSTGVGAIVATTSAGVISDWLARRGARWRMYYAALLAGVGAPCLLGALLADDIRIVAAFILGFSLTAGGLTAITNAAMVSIARPDMRAFTMAMSALVVTVMAAGCAPWVIGALNDHLATTFGTSAIRYSLILMPTALMLTCGLYAWASRSIERDEDAALEGVSAPTAG
jgi:predicted MFS family arabinose efflux permease